MLDGLLIAAVEIFGDALNGTHGKSEVGRVADKLDG